MTCHEVDLKENNFFSMTEAELFLIFLGTLLKCKGVIGSETHFTSCLNINVYWKCEYTSIL